MQRNKTYRYKEAYYRDDAESEVGRVGMASFQPDDLPAPLARQLDELVHNIFVTALQGCPAECVRNATAGVLSD